MVAHTLPINGHPVLLNEFDKDEWRTIAMRLRPDWTEEEFEAAWAEFVAMKRSKGMQ